MSQLLGYWFKSLLFISSPELIRMIYGCCKSLYDACKQVLLRFWILIGIDLLIFIMFGRPLMEYLGDGQTIARHAHPALWILNHVAGIVWVLLNAVVFLLLSRNDQQPESVISFIKRSALRFFVFKVATAFLLSIMFVILIIFGIRALPPVGTSLVLSYMAIETVVLQFWLASDGTQAGFLRSCEKGVNFVLYNFPVVLFFMTMLWIANFVLASIFINGAYAYDAGSMLLSMRIDQIFANQQNGSPLQFVVFRYCKLLTDFFWLSCLIALYRRYHRVAYSNSVLQ